MRRAIAQQKEISLKAVSKKDKRMLFNWRNDPYLISLGSSGKEVTWREHSKWFDKVLAGNTSFIYIIWYDKKPVGQIRFDLSGDREYSISIYILKPYTGKGIGRISLEKGVLLATPKNEKRTFFAFVKKGNNRSISAFLKAGFYVDRRFKQVPKGHTVLKRTVINSVGKFDLSSVRDFYKKKVKRYGYDIRSVAWGSRKSQQARFKVFSEIADLDKRDILDLGCGLGDFYGWLRRRGINANYKGIDISEPMIYQARRRYPNADFQVQDIFDMGKQDLTVDYCFASGIFNLKIKRHEQFIQDTISQMFAISRRGIAFNVMSDRADFKEHGEYYANPAKILNLCLGITRKSVLRHDYMPHDITVYMYREEKR